MKNQFTLLLIALLFSACIKEAGTKTPLITVDPIPPKIISSDTLNSGGQWGLTVGQSASALYSRIQEIKIERHIGNLSIVGNVFTSLETLKDKLPLYTSIYLDETLGTGTGIQIYFEDDKVKSVWTNDGVGLKRWPLINGASASVTVGDPIGGVYQKLVNIKKQAAYVNKFERISIFNKDINKVYDPSMSASRQWYFVSVIDDQRYNMVSLNFSAGNLVSIYSTIYEYK
ncbi:hypothetical protein [Mucilaginibacter psychrotolerans]|uniref:Lipoprotein n=1 Tax=Mucilaginibacter psychrotolerans TaxID=1524096 RepID=A0A4Y8SML4_9SPHI|nr:hypothetical protein [Mucilaginibacter psychrotolerans]TFF40299.1 hypothetical protein E2R66_03355 [Mucilaginibacter psychrotolerans]